MISRKLTYANVVSTLALLVAVAGGSTAIAISAKKNSVTSKSIKPGNVTASDLAPIQIVTGPGTGADAGTNSPGQPNANVANCPNGTRLIGGGAQGTGIQYGDAGATQLQRSYPVGNGWSASGRGGNISPYALCLSGKPGKQ